MYGCFLRKISWICWAKIGKNGQNTEDKGARVAKTDIMDLFELYLIPIKIGASLVFMHLACEVKMPPMNEKR